MYMKRAPCLLRVEDVKNWSEEIYHDGKFRPRRPYAFGPLRTRIRIAWGVFTARYDAVAWHKQ